MTKEEYYALGSPDDFVLHSSIMRYLIPDEGGSFAKLTKALQDKEEQKETVSLERGKLIHQWLEDPSSIHVMEVDKPSGTTGDIADLLWNMLLEENKSPTEIKDHIFVKAARDMEWNPKWGDEAILKNIKKGVMPYLEERYDYSDRIPVSIGTREILEATTAAMLSIPEVAAIITGRDFNYTEKEVPLTATIDGVPCKGLLDILGFVSDKATYFDLKTTSSPIDMYMGYNRYSIKELGVTSELVHGAFQRYKTYRQLKFYEMLLEANNINIVDLRLIVVETKPPYEVRMVKVSEDYPNWLLLGELEIKKILSRAKDYMDGVEDRLYL